MIHTYVCTYIHTYIHTYKHTYDTFIHTHIQTYIHTCIHIHTYLHCLLRETVVDRVLLTPSLLPGHLLPVLLRSKSAGEEGMKEETGGECVGVGDGECEGGGGGSLAAAGEGSNPKVGLIVEAMRWGLVPSYSKADSVSDALKTVCVCV
jgi:hypothetical protein